jgi:hypothetical protein
MPKCSEGKIALGGLAAIFVWAFVILPLLYYPVPKSAHNDQRPADGQHEANNVGNEPPAFVALKLFTLAGRNEIAQYCGAHTEQERQDWTQKYVCDIKITDAYIAVFNGLLVLVTFGLIAVGVLTIRKMRVTEERQLRAYVSDTPSGMRFSKVDKAFAVVFVNENHGQTPAGKMRHFTTIELIEHPLPNDFILTPPARDRASTVTLFPGSKREATSKERKFTDAELLEAFDGTKLRFYFFAITRYEDVFKTTHETRLCVNIGGPKFREAVEAAVASPGGPFPLPFEYVDQHNGAD